MLKATPQDEHGMSVVEVVVAVLMASVVAIGLVMAISSASNAQVKTKIRGEQVAMSEAAYDRLQNDTEWSRSDDFGCNNMDMSAVEIICNEAKIHAIAFPPTSKTQNGVDVEFEKAVGVKGIDSTADGLGSKDQDGVRPDFYEVDVRIGGGPQVENKVEVMRGTINPAARTTGGSLMVQICLIGIQYDSRLPIGSCPQKGTTWLAAPNEPNEALPIIAAMASQDAMYAMRATLEPADASVSFQLTPLTGTPAPKNGKVSARLPDGSAGSCSVAGTGTVSCAATDLKPGPLSGADRDPDAAAGMVQVNGLPPGRYGLTSNVPGKGLWGDKSVPGGGVVQVEAGTRNRVMQVMRPMDDITYTIRLRSCTNFWVVDTTVAVGKRLDRTECDDKLRGGHTFHLVPAPHGRARKVSASTTSSDSEIRFVDIPRGLYLGQLYKDEQRSPTNFYIGGYTDGPPFMFLTPERPFIPASGTGTHSETYCEPSGDDFLCPKGPIGPPGPTPPGPPSGGS